MKRWYLEVKVSVGNVTFWHELKRLDQHRNMSDKYMVDTLKRHVAVNLADPDVWRIRTEESRVVHVSDWSEFQ